MKKTLIALAAMASMSAFAQSSVTLYGVADIWFGSLKAETGGTATVAPTGVRQTLLNSGGLNGSRWGLKGSEDLGGGLKANFQFESGFDLDTGTSAQGALFGRQAFVGLSGGFGEVRFGRQYTAYDELRGATNSTFDSAFTPTGNVWTATGGDYAGRANNQLYYATPDFGGFSGAIGYALGEDKTATTNASNILSLHAKYANGPILVGIAHQSEKLAAGAGTNKYTLLAGSYDFGVVKLTGGYNDGKAAAAGSPKQKEFQLGLSAPIGAATISAGYAQGKAGNTKSNGFGLAATYDLSKRTAAYAGLETDKTKDTGVTTTKNTLYAVGVRHRF